MSIDISEENAAPIFREEEAKQETRLKQVGRRAALTRNKRHYIPAESMWFVDYYWACCIGPG
jgi:hypothetical protein